MEEFALIFKALSDINRIKIIQLLLQGEKWSCTLIDQLPVTQPTLSYHLKVLFEAGLIMNEQNGNKINHYVVKSKFDEISSFFKDLFDSENVSCKWSV